MGDARTDINARVPRDLSRFFASYGDAKMRKAAMKALRFLTAGDEPMGGKPEGWAAGIVYAWPIATDGLAACRGC